MNCEICSNTMVVPERCEYCGKLACNACVKSSKRLAKVRRLVICRRCWGNLKTRKKFKSE